MGMLCWGSRRPGCCRSIKAQETADKKGSGRCSTGHVYFRPPADELVFPNASIKNYLVL